MKLIENKEFGGERPLYCEQDLHLKGVTIHIGESGLKECKNILCEDCTFEGKNHSLYETAPLKKRRAQHCGIRATCAWKILW